MSNMRVSNKAASTSGVVSRTHKPRVPASPFDGCQTNLISQSAATLRIHETRLLHRQLEDPAHRDDKKPLKCPEQPNAYSVDNGTKICFDVIMSFFSGYMLGAGTTAHRHTRTVIRVP